MRRLSGLVARPDGSVAPGLVAFDQRIESVEPASRAGGDYILPGLIDLQLNGSHGIDVMNASAQALSRLACSLAADGVTAFLPTVITSTLERIEQAHRSIGEAIASQSRHKEDRSATILGMHLEGPFISPLRLGAHPALSLEPYGEPLIRVLRLDSLRLLTLAPELTGACEAIRLLAAGGVVVSMGHSNATLPEVATAIAAGARMFTHVFNAMRPLHHRDPGIVGAALLPSPAYAAVIADGVHVDPAVLRIIFAARGAHGIILVSDKVAQAGGSDGVARLADGTLAGSGRSVLDGLRLMVEKIGASAGEAAVMAATNPARLLGLSNRGRIEVGCRADLMVLDRELKLKTTIIAGGELT